MPIRSAAGTRVPYYLTVFDNKGNERPEPDGTLLTTAILARLAQGTPPVTDIFVMSHGWQGDIPGAIGQYDAWIGAMAAAKADLDAARSTPGFEPLIVGLHWPSLPWGDETIPPGPGLLSADDERPIEQEVEAYASRIADTPAARAAIRAILDSARKEPAPAPLSQNVRAAYATLFAESGLKVQGSAGAPGADQEAFDPEAIIKQAGAERPSSAVPGVLGFGDGLKDIVLTPLRQLSFWKMKDRARRVGEGAGHELLRRLMRAAPKARFHLMGHSFGCIVVTASIAGAKESEPLPRPVDTLFLVQGALSIWAYTDSIPYVPGTAGYFERIVANRLVSGPIVTTRSRFDRAVGFFYPLGAGSAGQIVLAAEDYPPFGGLGAFGIQGVKDAEDRAMLPLTSAYDFEPGRIYNLEASDVIRNGSGPSGAHSDIAHPEVAHAYWEAVRAGRRPGLEQNRVLGGLLIVESAVKSSAGGGQPLPGAKHWFRVNGTVDSAKKGGARKAAATRTSGKQTAKKAAAEEGQARKPTAKKAGSRKGATQKTSRKKGAAKKAAKGGRARKSPAKKSSAHKSAAKPKPNPPAQGLVRAEEPDVSPGHLEPSELTPPLPSDSAVPREAQQAQAQIQSAPPPTERQRWISAEVEGRRRGEALAKGAQYVLSFDVDIGRRENAVGAALLDDSQIFARDVEEATLTVQLDSDDFVIDKRADSLVVPREGVSSKKASFKIAPRHDGISKIKATIHLKGNFIQQMELSFDVGAKGATEVAVTALGRPASAVAVVQPRDIGLSISPGVGGYDLIVWGAVMARARLPIQPADLAKAVDVARDELMKIVMHRNADNTYVFQAGVDIPAADQEAALEIMARAGATLFRKLFWGPSMAADANRVGDFLRKMAADTPKLKLQILADSAPIPWGMLYFGDASAGAKLDWSNFLGMRHVIEMIPLQNTLAVASADIPSDQPRLAVSLNVNRGIDQQMGVNLVAEQEAYWADANKRGKVRVVPRATKAELVKALASENADDQILYFYCHAKSADLAATGGPDSACIVLSDGSVTLGDLNLDAPTTKQLLNAPLVFINACESAEMSPAFYDGFVPYFMAKGARGVVGTECKTPALFAAEWAKRFFPRFLRGEALGETFLALRRELLEQHGNPLGLLYAVHSDGDTRIKPPLALAG
jgi:hypothetical protein